MTSEADAIASVVLREFNRLPAKRKPQARENGTREWVPLSGIVARQCDGSLCCLALAYVQQNLVGFSRNKKPRIIYALPQKKEAKRKKKKEKKKTNLFTSQSSH